MYMYVSSLVIHVMYIVKFKIAWCMMHKKDVVSCIIVKISSFLSIN